MGGPIAEIEFTAAPCFGDGYLVATTLLVEIFLWGFFGIEKHISTHFACYFYAIFAFFLA
jgi:hypothetical protein